MLSTKEKSIKKVFLRARLKKKTKQVKKSANKIWLLIVVRKKLILASYGY